jgi:8-oxo-dGTP diphosphatase
MTGTVALKIREGSSAILISTDGRLLFQLRDCVPNISDPGKLDFFGGGLEGDESFLDCVVREVQEEIGLYLAPERFEFVGRNVGPDHWVPDCILHDEIFLARGVPIEHLTITEGSLRIVAFDELEHIRDLLATSAKRALEVFLKREQTRRPRESR